jgi:hypothetical protein
MAIPLLRSTTCGFFLFLLLWSGPPVFPQAGHQHPSATPPPTHPQSSMRITMEDLHKHDGVPPRWRFSLPMGDPTAGQEVFIKLECFQCHAVKGEQFPETGKEASQLGPELTGWGGITRRNISPNPF